MHALLHDIRAALRGLRRSPLFVLVAVASIGAGIGANTAVFSWMDSLVLRPFPGVADPDRLVGLEVANPDGRGVPLSYPTFRDWRADSRSFSGVAAWTIVRASAREVREAASMPILAMTVSGNYFDVLDVAPLVGRALTVWDDHDATPVAVLSHPFWSRRYGMDPTVIGRTLSLNGEPVTIVGVAPPRFVGTYVGVVPDLFLPITLHPRLTGTNLFEDRDVRWVQSFARLAPGVSVDRAQIELDALARRLSTSYGERPATGALVVEARKRYLGGLVFPVFLALLAVSALLLLIACANVASLLIVRVQGARYEIALRTALGAARSRIVLVRLIEGLLLALGGGAVGIFIAHAARGVLYLFVPTGPFPITLEIALNARVLAVAFSIACVVTLICSVGPLVSAMRIPPALSLHSGSRTVSRGGSRLRLVLVAGQLSFTVLCLAVASLFLRGLRASAAIDPGFTDAEHVLLVGTDYSAARVPEARGPVLVDQMLQRLRALPGVEGATVSTMVPLGFGGRRTANVSVEGYAPRANESMTMERALVGSDYAHTMGIDVVAGRDFAETDRPSGIPVALVNETLARRFWPGATAIGRRIDAGHGWATVVGVLRDGKYGSLTELPQPVAYFAIAQWFQPAMTIHLRTSADPRGSIESVRQTLQQIHIDLPSLQPRTLAEHIAAATFLQRVGATVLSAFGAVALLLSAVGLYAALAHAVAARRKELSIRLALGATGRAVSWVVLRDALVVGGAGSGIGFGLALVAGRAIRSQLGGVSPGDPTSLGAAIVLLLLTVAVTTCPSILRAVRVAPASVLSGE